MAVVKSNNKAITNVYNQGLQRGVALAKSIGAAQIAKGIYDYGIPAAKYVYATAKKARRNKKNAGMQIAGAGSNSIVAPVAVSERIKGRSPRFRQSNGCVTIEHEELLSTISNSGAFTTNGGVAGNIYALNPSNGNLFTWLTQIAANFDEYRFRTISLRYVPLCGTDEKGRVALYYDRDSRDPEPSNRVELANYAVRVETMPWAKCSLRVPTDNTIRLTNDSATTDAKFLNLGQVGFVTYAGVGTNFIGDIYIAYEVELFKPQPSSSILQSYQSTIGQVEAFSDGTRYIEPTQTATLLTMTFRSPGTYVIFGVMRSLTFIAYNVTGGALTNSSTVLQSGATAVMFELNITVATLPSAFTISGTGFTALTFQCIRAEKTNTVNVL